MTKQTDHKVTRWPLQEPVKFLYFFISGVKRSKKLNKDKIELIDQIACDRNNVYVSD